MTVSPFERDITAQGQALRSFAQSMVPARLDPLLRGDYGRVILTGMGSSHFAALPTWRSLVNHGHPAWWVDSGQLLDADGLVTADTLLVVTSQSGASGEVVALLADGSRITRPGAVVAITNDTTSPLALAADVVLELNSGDEATVSTKSYLNTLAAHQRLLAAFDPAIEGGGVAWDAAKLVEQVQFDAEDVARAAWDAPAPRFAMIGTGDHAATALYAGLITKEAAKVAAEGYIGGQFRHGPLELAGPGLTALLFGARTDDPNPSLRQLASELVASGSAVLLIGDLHVPGARTVHLPSSGGLSDLCVGAVVAQLFAVALARVRGIEPGAFHYGRKITTAL